MNNHEGYSVPSALHARSLAVSAKTLADKAFFLIKADIIDCVLPPGELLSAQQLMAHIGMGLSAVRAAMERLVAGHWVTSAPNKGYRIDGITLKDVIELYDLSEMISPQLARMSCGRIDDVYDQLVLLAEEANGPRQARNEEEEHGVLLATGEILRTIRIASNNSYAIALTQQITERLDRVVAARRHYSSAPIDFRRDFRPLIEALRDNQPDAADAASRSNVRRMRSIVIDHILRAEAFANSRILAGM
ncbi:MAG TPA: GntR family transcriptional regulator [Pelagibacterium sp.]|uniref:GntR family transcriptional regulator n=1 Tax=Pelagibacterium sp. TaxID=1967288 RepID=UPI002D0E8375|nr:GntR family transcriptional regulator [Pelagibacterium sp.]HWJ87905.1 GntR family transcriptional regulator [Pelagibacterium sp.]